MNVGGSADAAPGERARNLVFEVRTAATEDAPKSAYGSGWVVDPRGLVVTNYHVVDAVVRERDASRVFVIDGKRSWPAEVIEIDAVHDLALLRVAKSFSGGLPLALVSPKLGEKIFSVGIPMDLDLSVVEGNYNGVLSYGPYDSIHISAPLNPGMSGGPTLNEQGEVIGVNVSILGRSQNISFAVPITHVRQLLQKGRSHPRAGMAETVDVAMARYRRQIEEQLHSAQQRLAEDLIGRSLKRMKLPGFEVNRPSEILNCWSRQDTERKFRYTTTYYVCDLHGATLVGDNVLSGTYQLSYEVIRNHKLNRWQFFSLLNERYNADQDFVSIFFESSPDDYFTDFHCVDVRTQTPGALSFKANVCFQGLLRFSSLMDAELKVATLNQGRDALVFRLRLYGFTLENIKRMVRSELTGIRIR